MEGTLSTDPYNLRADLAGATLPHHAISLEFVDNGVRECGGIGVENCGTDSKPSEALVRLEDMAMVKQSRADLGYLSSP